MNANGFEPPSTRSLWGSMTDMFGLGGLLRAASDPAVMQQAVAMMATIAEGGRVARRIEAKLDMLLAEGGIDVAAVTERINRQIDADAQLYAPPRIAALPEPQPSAGTGGHSAASPPFDNGSGDAQAATQPVRETSGEAGHAAHWPAGT